ncbi:sulfurtransferase FdhD [Thalassotalea insulae]|uniref:Sulfur carrier protein FdhD n=1 Tax=Thalassotalea insulae TaxID=2056778 RepID=A0ABQ6GWW2_9GAMM|nr:formate dehydrogenase accessory sulfurtransferase FdhD [Thalassotalea insulae]GLX80433.1 sulfurtransferase FdhD [Thalassotalea insulae]
MTIIAKPDSSDSVDKAKDEQQPIKIVSKYVYQGNDKQLIQDQVITELPLQIRLIWQEQQQTKQQINSKIFSITMRTPGQDQALILGLLYCEGIIKTFNDVIKISAESESTNQWEVKLATHCQPDLTGLERYQLSYSSCGICGTTSLKSLELKNPPTLSDNRHWLNASAIYNLPKMMIQHQRLFQQTGGVHAAALFDENSQIIQVNEDIGRHNAIDKLVGSLIDGQTKVPKNSTLVVSSRVSFEIVQKAVMLGVPVLIAVGAPTDLAITAAQRFNLTLIGFAGSQSFNLYHGHWRLKALPKE